MVETVDTPEFSNSVSLDEATPPIWLSSSSLIGESYLKYRIYNIQFIVFTCYYREGELRRARAVPPGGIFYNTMLQYNESLTANKE